MNIIKNKIKYDFDIIMVVNIYYEILLINNYFILF
jgi:hypothetical protein